MLDIFEMVAVKNLLIGDHVDLEADKYADPTHDINAISAFEWAEVLVIEKETDDCIRVEFDQSSIGFPPDHELKVCRPRPVEFEYMVCLDGGPPPTAYWREETSIDPYLALGSAQDLKRDYPDAVVTVVVIRKEN